MNVIHIDLFYLDDVPFRNIGWGMLECTNQLNYKTSPGRQSDGSMQNINNYDSFVVPQLKIGFNLIQHEEFVNLRSMLLSKRTFLVRYYDIDFNKFVVHEMYAHPDELKNFLNLGTRVIGLQNFTLTFVGTLNGKDAIIPEEYGVEGLDPIEYDPRSIIPEFDTELQNLHVLFGDEKNEIAWGRSITVPDLPYGYSYWEVPENSIINATKKLKLYPKDRVNIYEHTTFVAR